MCCLYPLFLLWCIMEFLKLIFFVLLFKSWDYYTPRLWCDWCNSFDIMCLSVCLSVSLSRPNGQISGRIARRTDRHTHRQIDKRCQNYHIHHVRDVGCKNQATRKDLFYTLNFLYLCPSTPTSFFPKLLDEDNLWSSITWKLWKVMYLYDGILLL